jgi:hypothetical protein
VRENKSISSNINLIRSNLRLRGCQVEHREVDLIDPRLLDAGNDEWNVANEADMIYGASEFNGDTFFSGMTRTTSSATLQLR